MTVIRRPAWQEGIGAASSCPTGARSDLAPVDRTKKPQLVSVDVLHIGTLRDQAHALMQWARELHKAEMSGDLAAVAAVREDIARCSQALACIAADAEARSKAPR